MWSCGQQWLRPGEQVISDEALDGPLIQFIVSFECTLLDESGCFLSVNFDCNYLWYQYWIHCLLTGRVQDMGKEQKQGSASHLSTKPYLISETPDAGIGDSTGPTAMFIDNSCKAVPMSSLRWRVLQVSNYIPQKPRGQARWLNMNFDTFLDAQVPPHPYGAFISHFALRSQWEQLLRFRNE